MVVVIAALSGGNSSSGDPAADASPSVSIPSSTDPAPTPSQQSEEPKENSGTVQSGTYTLPCGMTIQFFDSVRNDVTGNWRRAATSDSYVPADYALQYYTEMFSSDDEVHSIWNATLKTTTRITVSGNLLFVDTLEYVKGEEHDAKVMFSGMLLDSRIIDIETGAFISEEPNVSDESSTLTIGQKNALSSAKNYLSVMAFSYSGLIKQLEYEQYSTDDATYAADNCGADWNEQALKSAKNYLNIMVFSYTGLIGQLEYEGFTNEQATYGADNCQADWNEQAVKSAKIYLDTMPFSKDSLISQLEYEGFTHDQAVYGAEQNGY